MEKTLEKLEKLLKLAGESSVEELFEALEKILPQEEEKKAKVVKFKIGWAVGNGSDPGNHCSIFIKVDNKQ